MGERKWAQFGDFCVNYLRLLLSKVSPGDVKLLPTCDSYETVIWRLHSQVSRIVSSWLVTNWRQNKVTDDRHFEPLLRSHHEHCFAISHHVMSFWCHFRTRHKGHSNFTVESPKYSHLKEINRWIKYMLFWYTIVTLTFVTICNLTVILDSMSVLLSNKDLWHLRFISLFGPNQWTFVLEN